MKKSVLVLVTAIALGLMNVTTLTAQTKEKVQTKKGIKTETFKVYGNCGMCKTRIEEAAKSIKGVKSAEWDVESKMMTVTWNESKSSLDDVSNGIASAGHDTKWNTAKGDVYGKLPGCCQYDRKESGSGTKKKSGCGHNH